MFFSIINKNMLRVYIATVFTFIIYSSTAQIGIGINPPDSSAMLHVQDTARGLLIPRMTAAQKAAIHNPAEGLMVYQTNEDKGYWYYTGTEWTSVAHKGGSYMILLTGNITDAEAQAKIAAEAGPNTLDIRISGCTNLTTVDLSGIAKAASILILDNPVLKHVDLRNVVSVLGGQGLIISRSPMIDYLNLSSLQAADEIYSLNYGLSIGLTNLTTIALPSLVKVGLIKIGVNPVATTISMPLLQSCTYMNISGLPQLTSIDLSSLTTSGGQLISNNPLLTTISIPNLSGLLTTQYDFSLNKLSVASVNNILHVFASIPGISGKTIKLEQSTPAPPSGQGITDLNFLRSNSNTVTTN